MFHVFVEGAADASPEGLTRLANAMASKYGLPAAELRARLQAGRFRVKGNVDRQTAVSYMRDLEILGARCAIEEATAANSMATPPAGVPVARPSTPPAGTPAARPSTPNALTDQPPSRPSAPPSALAGMPRAATPAPVPGSYASGLSAAFSSDSSPAAGLGALESDGAPLSLSSVDGADSSQPNVIEKSPEPAFGVPASIGPAMATPDKAKKPARPKDEPLDMFAPPDAQDAELAVDIADDEKDFDARKRASTPPAAAPVVRPGSQPSVPTLRPKTDPAASSSSRLAKQPAATSLPSKLGPLANERVRTIAGVVLAIVLGFVPAHFIAHSREASAYRDLDARLVSIQSSADTPEAWATLDKTRADFLDRKHEERRNIALMALAIWALVGGAIGYGWFKRVPWDEL